MPRSASAPPLATPRPAPRVTKLRSSVDDIAERVLNAIWEHRLPPGTKLVEDKLAGIFGVSRTKIRQALARLAHDGILTIEPNRGTFVSSPTIDEARQVFNARRLLEPALMHDIVVGATKAQIARLRSCTALEAAARASDDRRAVIRLSGEFHILLADMAGNPFLVKMTRELCSLTCLIIALYDSPGIAACPHHEHGALVDAIEARDAGRCAMLMREHLDHVEHSLELEVPAGAEIDLAAVFA